MLRAEPVFARWAVAEGVSMAGTAVSQIVLPVIVYDLTRSASLTGLLFATRLLPYLLLGLLAGPVADRGNRRRLIIGGNLTEGILAASIPLAALFGVLTVAQVFVVALMSAVAFVFSDAAVFGAVPALVRPDRVAAANGVLATIASITDIAGSVVAGGLIATVGAPSAIWVNAAGFLIAASVQLTIHSNLRRVASEAPLATIRQQLAAARQFIWGERTVMTLILAGFGNSIGIGMVLGLLVPWSIEVLGYEHEDARLGLLYAASGVGSLLAGLVFPRLFKVGRVAVLTPTTLAWSTLWAGALVVGAGWLAAPAILAFSFGIMLTIAIGITYLQLATPDQLTSTVNTIGRMVAAGGQPLGAAFGALIVTLATVTTAYVVAAGAMGITAVAAFLALRAQPPART